MQYPDFAQSVTGDSLHRVLPKMPPLSAMCRIIRGVMRG